MHPRDDQVYPLNTVVRIKKTGEFAIIVGYNFLKDGKGFLNYYAEIQDKKGKYALYHGDLEVEVLG
jgi:hypothetical protein